MTMFCILFHKLEPLSTVNPSNYVNSWSFSVPMHNSSFEGVLQYLPFPCSWFLDPAQPGVSFPNLHRPVKNSRRFFVCLILRQFFHSLLRLMLLAKDLAICPGFTVAARRAQRASGSVKECFFPSYSIYLDYPIRSWNWW